MFKQLLVVAGLCFAASLSQAQVLLASNKQSTKQKSIDKEVKGKVVDGKTGDALPGVSVMLKGTTRGTTTSADGTYSINATDNGTLVLSFVGYESKEISVANGTFNVVLTPSTETLAEVAVIGSRAATARTNIETAVPVDVITPKELKGFSQVDLSQILNYVAPSFNSNRQTVADGTDHIDPASLRGLGPDQVLVLVNGKRRHTSALVNINGTVGRGSVGTDMNVIPVAAIERIEVLRDGAAAQYGSDAIAGVINVVLKKDYKGLSASLTAGQNMTTLAYATPNINGGTDAHSHHVSDGGVVQFDISKGLKLGSKGALTVSAQYNERGKSNRSGMDNAPTIYLGSAGGFPGTPTAQVQNDFRKKLITDDATIATQNGYNRQNMVFGNSSSRNMGLFLNGSIAPTAKSEVYFSAGITNRIGKGFGNNRVPVSRGQQPLNGDGSLAYPNGFLPAIESAINDQSLIAGYKTTFNGWRMDLSNTYGANSFGFTVSNSGNATLPNGTLQSTFDAGTLKFSQNTTNLDFAKMIEKAGPIAGLNLAFGAEFRRDQYQIAAGEANSYSGAVKVVPAAPILPGGPANGTATALPGAQVFPGFQPANAINKSRTNLGFYGDIEGEIANRLLVGMAARYENYSDFGSNVSGKISARLKIMDGLALRGSASTGFRAPSLHQRYFSNISTQFVSGLPSNTLTVNNDDPIAKTIIGVASLKAETSQSATVGVTTKIGKTTLTVDAYSITIKDRIVYSGAFGRSVFDAPTQATLLTQGVNNVNFFANAANTSTKGIDVVLNGRYDVGKGKLAVTLAYNYNQNKVDGINSTTLIDRIENNENSGRSPDSWFKNLLFDRQQRSRIEVWQPLNKLNVSATYSLGKFDVTLRAVRFGEVQYIHNVDTEAKKADGTFWNTQFSRDANGKAYIDQVFQPVTITDLILNFRATKQLNVSVGANNLLDVYPDQIYIDPRNAYGSVDYVSGRDASNRGRLLFQPNQGGYNGRFVFTRLTFTM
jgi:iron complex outermembrane recepter protein